MSLDITKLKNVVVRDNGEIVAQCPACAAVGGDTKGEHLIIFSDGRYGCVANQGDKEHSAEIYRLAALSTEEGPQPPRQIQIRSVKVPPSAILMDLSTFERFRRPLRRRLENVEAIACGSGMAEAPREDSAPAVDVDLTDPRRWTKGKRR